MAWPHLVLFSSSHIFWLITINKIILTFSFDFLFTLSLFPPFLLFLLFIPLLLSPARDVATVGGGGRQSPALKFRAHHW